MFILYTHHFGFYIYCRPNLFICGITEFTARLLDLFIRQPNKFTSFVFHSKQYDTTFAVGKGNHFLGNLPLRSECLFELHFSGLATKA